MEPTIDQIREKIAEAAKDYPLISKRIKNERGLAYCANRISHMITKDGCTISGAIAWLESELEGMD